MFRLKDLFAGKTVAISLSKTQKELLELLIVNKSDFDEWNARQAISKIRFQFFYPTALTFYYDEFKLFYAYFKKNAKGDIALQEFKMSETNFDTIRCGSWKPFEEMIIEFLTSLEENKKIALFEKRKTLFEYQSLCSKANDAAQQEAIYENAASTTLHTLKTTQ